MKKVACGFISAFLIQSCSVPGGEPATADRITIDWEAPAPKWNVQKIVPLETNPETFYGSSYFIGANDKNIFIRDFTQILVFDLNGKYLSKIDRVGHGPQEYIQIMDFWPQDDKVYIVDVHSQKILAYTLTGEFIHSYSFGFMPCAVAVSEQFIALNAWDNPNGTLVVMDHNGKTLYESISPILAKTTYTISAKFPFTKAGGQLYYLPNFSSSIYTVGADTSDIRKTTFDFGVYTLTPELVSTLTATTSREIFAKNEVVNFLSFYPTRLWWGLTFSLKGTTYQWYYNTKTGKQYISTLKGSREFKPITCVMKECFVASVEASLFLEDERFAPYREGIAVGEEDNAVLIFYTVE